MTALDYFVLVVAGVSFVLGFIKGLIGSVMSVASAIAGLIAAAYLYPYTGKIAGWFVSSPASEFIGFIGVFLLVLLAGAVISRSVRGAVRRAHLGWADRVLGGVFGLLRGWLVCSVVYIGLTAFPIRIEAVERSTFSPALLSGARLITYVTSRSMRTRFLSGYDSVADSRARSGGHERRR